VTFDGGGRVSEGFGDEGHWGELGEFMEGSQPGGPGAEHPAETGREVSGVDVSAWWGSAEYPIGVGVRGG
jgi:hypothetical protein